jgi:D-alanyl-D-alanine carboxypeptidase
MRIFFILLWVLLSSNVVFAKANNVKKQLVNSSKVSINKASLHKSSANKVTVNKFASLVIDTTNSRILHAINADAPRSPASLTKLMTLYLTFEAINKGYIFPSTEMEVSKFAASRPQTNLSLRAGEKIKVKDAIVALIVRSANDAAVVLAEYLGGSEEKFARMMTKKARMLGMNTTVFKNASGLPAKGQVTTAFEMAKLSLALRRNFPQLYPLFSVTSFKYKNREYTSHNKLTKHYINVDGLKTGYTAASGFNLVSSVTNDNKKLIGVVLGGNTAKERDLMMLKLLQKYTDVKKDNIKNPANPIEASDIFDGM